MKINTQIPLKDLDGNVLKDNDKDATVARTVSGALVAGIKGEETSPTDAADRYDLAVRLRNSDEIDLSSEEIALCKKMVAKVYPPIISGQVAKILEGKL